MQEYINKLNQHALDRNESCGNVALQYLHVNKEMTHIWINLNISREVSKLLQKNMLSGYLYYNNDSSFRFSNSLLVLQWCLHLNSSKKTLAFVPKSKIHYENFHVFCPHQKQNTAFGKHHN